MAKKKSLFKTPYIELGALHPKKKKDEVDEKPKKRKRRRRK